jgi:hypothetical protein
MKSIIGLIACVSFCLTCNAQVSEGAKMSGSVPVGDRQFALPPGEWQVVAVSDGFVTTGVDRTGANRTVYLVQVDGGKHLIAIMQVVASLSSIAGNSSWTSEPCKRGDTLHRDTLDGNFKYPACLLINHLTNFWQGEVPGNPVQAKIWTWLRDNKIDVPYTAIMAEYSKYFAGDFAVVRVWLSPDAAGIEPAPRVSWSASPWHPKLIKDNTQRQAYVDSVKVWANAMVVSSRNSFMGSKTAVAPLPALPGVK